MSSLHSWKIRLHVITPTHIGCGEVYEPTGFYIDKTTKKLISFDPLDFVGSLTDTERSRFIAICEKGTLESIVEIYRFMDGVRNRPSGHEVEISDGFIENYRNVLSLGRDKVKQELNKFQISRTSFLPHDNLPYIPGTALKGSLRTGWLNLLHGGRKREIEGKKAKEFETELLEGSFETDPFRMLKVPDLLPVEVPGTRICYAVNKKKKPSKHEARGPVQILEVILPGTAAFEGIVTIHTPQSGAGISKPLPAAMEFFRKATAFFSGEMDAEETILKGINVPALVRQKMQKQFGDRFLKTVFPVRIGRHSGAECLTIDGVRKIKILGKSGEKPRDLPHSTTVWLAGDSPKATSGLEPFGWCAIELADAEPSALGIHRVTVDLSPRPAVASLTPVQTARPEITVNRTKWEGATLAWVPGTGTLVAQSADGKKAETKDRNLIPDEVINRLKKGKVVRATVGIEQEGNSFRIVALDLN